MADKVDILGTGATKGIGAAWDDASPRPGGTMEPFGSVQFFDRPNTTTVDIAGIAESLQKKGKK